MKNIHILPTDKPSQLYAKDNNYKLANSTMAMDWYVSSVGYKPQNIYITSDEKIKEVDYYIHGDRIHRHLGKKCLDVLTNKEFLISRMINDSVFKKIILTTDQDLIKDGVQTIDDEFLEWFCSQNGKVNFVEVIAIEDEKN